MSREQAADLGWLSFSGNALCGYGARLPADLSYFAVGALAAWRA